MNDTIIGENQLSELILRLHRLSDTSTRENYQADALAEIQQYLHFDGAWWGLVSDMEVHNAFEQCLSIDFRNQWERIKDQDLIAATALSNPRKTTNYLVPDSDKTSAFNKFLINNNIRAVLCTLVNYFADDHYSFLSLYRSAEPFDESERLLIQNLMQHLAEAHHRTWKNALITHQQANNQVPTSNCIVDQRGLLYSCDANFAGFLKAEWPRWCGAFLPEELIAILQNSSVFRGKRLRAESQSNGDFMMVSLSMRDHLAELTVRESQTASRFASGATYKEVAKQMGISPTTVRHYLRNVYAKLHISNKAELVRKINRLG